MSTKVLLTSLTFLGIVGVLVVAATATPARTASEGTAGGPIVAAAPATSGGWAYKVMPRAEIIEMAPGHRGEYILPKDLLGDLNGGLQVLGEQGWELVAVEPYHTEGYVRWPAMYVFRRPR